MFLEGTYIHITFLFVCITSVISTGLILLLCLHMKRYMVQIQADVNSCNQNLALLHSALIPQHLQLPVHIKDPGEQFNKNCALYKLTNREKEIASMILQGDSYKSIGNTLFISERTVTKHVQHIFEKVAVSNKIGLIKKLEGYPNDKNTQEDV